MGRKPNALILQFFERGPKLADNSNRYPHTCKSCGENFPKGRIDSLTTHLTRKCPAISESDRVRACLTIHGFTKAAAEQGTKPAPIHSTPARPPADAPPPDLDLTQRDWTALETLAEVSRQIDLSEKHDDRGIPAGVLTTADIGAEVTDRFDAQDHFTTVDPGAVGFKDEAGAVSLQEHVAQDEDATAGSPPADADREELTAEQQIHALLQSSEPASHSTALSVAAAATARLNPQLLDPQLRESTALAILQSTEVPQGDIVMEDGTDVAQQQPWGELTQSDALTISMRASQAADSLLGPQMMIKGGFRLSSPNSGKARHSRSRFDAHRRKEVQEVRKIGACIRCRILRKTCSRGHPCDTCRKVLSPRIWKSGCVRTKFSEQLDLYSAGVQIVLNQHRLNDLKAHVDFADQGTVLELSIFPESNFNFSVHALQSTGPKECMTDESGAPTTPWAKQDLLMIDSDKEDVQAKVELYMRKVLHEFVEREKSKFARITLNTALTLSHKTQDELLKKAIELWGLVEILDRERQWHILARFGGPEGKTRWIRDNTDQDCFTTVCLQLTAAAERKAAQTSKQLLTGMQRVLQDSKTKIDHNMFFTTLILLNCIEKTTWAFKAWEQDTLQPMWPLEKPPVSFTQQGYVLADLLKMLLGIRKVLPRTFCREPGGMLATQEPALHEYFHDLDLKYAEVQAKQENPIFSPTDSRSLGLLFCSTLLLSNGE